MVGVSRRVGWDQWSELKSSTSATFVTYSLESLRIVGRFKSLYELDLMSMIFSDINGKIVGDGY
jgi:hypothetical protein